MDTKLKLRINAKSLVAESRIIKEEERKLLSNRRGFWLENYQSIHSHRVENVRCASRVNHLARGYLAGKDYKSIEPKRKSGREYVFNTYVIPSILAKLKRFRVKTTKDEILEWIYK